MRRVLFVALFCIFAIVSVSAQSKADNFIGNWQMTSMKGSFNDSPIPTFYLDITRSGDKIKIVDSRSPNKNQVATKTYEFSIDGDNLVYLNKVGLGSSAANIEADFVSNNKLRILKSNYYTSDVREIWTISKDGKTLTIEEIITPTGQQSSLSTSSLAHTSSTSGAVQPVPVGNTGLFKKIVFTKQ